MGIEAWKWLSSAVGSGDLSWYDLADIVRYAQGELGVKVDGKPGFNTMTALDQHRKDQSGGNSLPVPRNRAEAYELYGKPSWVKLPRGRAVDIDDAWERRNILWFRLHTGKRVRMHRMVGAEFVRLFKEACDATPEYQPKSVQTYNPRVIGGTTRLSMHGLGVAADFDPQLNPWGAGPDAPLRKYPSFLQPFRDAGWTIGGDWRKGNGDWMHIQRCGT